MSDEDPPRRESRPVDGWPPDFDRLVIPDDPSELELELRALLRERRAAARSARWRRLSRWFGFRTRPTPAGVGLLLTAAILAVTSVVMLVRPAGSPPPESLPLANDPGHPVGAVGGLLPDARIDREGVGPVFVRSFRPAIVVLIPATLSTAPVLQSVVATAARHNLYALAVGTRLPTLPVGLARTRLIRGTDTDGALLTAYHVTNSPVLLLVRADGVVLRTLTGNPPESTLDAEAALLSD